MNKRNVTDMCAMFYGCSSLTDLDLSSFDTQSVTDTNVLDPRHLCGAQRYF